MLNRPLALSVLACLTLNGTAMAATADAIKPSPTPFATHYIVTKPDLRKCAAPGCGGYFVKAVNRALTRCADGSLQKECHVFSLNSSALGWSDADRATFEKSFATGHGLGRGALVAIKGRSGAKTDTLVISEGWVGQAGSKPLGVFYHLKNSGIVCITTPCPTITETSLNYPIHQNIDGVDLASSGARPAQVAEGVLALSRTGLLAVGNHKTTSGPAGQGLELVTSEFYLPVNASKAR